MTSDAHKITDFPGQPCLIKVVGAMVTKNVDEITLGGDNELTEGPSEPVNEGGTSQVVNIINDFRLEKYIKPHNHKCFGHFVRREWGRWVDGVRRILDENNKTEALKEFSGVNIKSALSYLRKNFNDDQVYFGESDTDFDGSTGYLNYEEDGVTPYMLFWKHALVEEKY